MVFVNGEGLILSGILSGLTAGFFTAYLSFYVFKDIPVEIRGVTLGISSALGITVQFIAFTILSPQIEGLYLIVKTFFTAVVILLAGILAVILPVCRGSLWPVNTGVSVIVPACKKPKPRMMPLLLLVLLCFFMSYGMQDNSFLSHIIFSAYHGEGYHFNHKTGILLLKGIK